MQILPSIFRLQEDVALPESVPIRFLADDSRAAGGIESLPRHERVDFLDNIWTNRESFRTKESVTQSAESIARDLGKFSAPASDRKKGERPNKQLAEQNLARDLIRKVAKIDPEALKELTGALRDGRDAFANSIIDEINDALRAKLNFPNWWVQDRQFRLVVSPREYDLVFTVRDRTETEYAFSERSSGLRYFMSYYIQYLAHERRTDRHEILLMDEPDAFLSSQGQQDLLKIFDAFANPDDGRSPIQVIYVTHSPFLIDKNHGERIRVLEKGAGEEGTRVVRDASRNHYEPLRSAFGSMVGETTFIGNCNLIVEGTADQILLAGAATYLRAAGASEVETLDLNQITIVPAGGAPHIPYLVYLARGRDVEKPAVIVMLDNDEEGNEAKKVLLRGGPRKKELLKSQYILQLGDLWADLSSTKLPRVVATEDLVPLAICADAARRYLQDVCGLEADVVEQVTPDTISAESLSSKGVFDSIQNCLRKINEELHIEKIGFARAIIESVAGLRNLVPQDHKAATTLGEFETNMKVLFKKLRRMQRESVRELTSERVSARVNRAKASFFHDHPDGAKREHAVILFEEIESALDNSEESDVIRGELRSIQREFHISDDLTEPIRDYGVFRERIDQVRYAARMATQQRTLQETSIDAAGTNSDSAASEEPTKLDGENGSDSVIPSESIGSSAGVS